MLSISLSLAEGNYDRRSYTVNTSVLGKGGMSVVYKARHYL